MACKICETRRARRFCPAAGGDICAICCGTGREETFNCPLDCEYLQQARAHEKSPELTRERIPSADIEVSDDFLSHNTPLVAAMMHALLQTGLNTPGAVDKDVRDALDAMVRTHRTLESGLYYESRPDNMVAARIQAEVEHLIADYRVKSRERLGISSVRDADVLGTLVFLQRIAAQIDNGRARGRAFLDFLRANLAAEEAASPGAPSLIVPWPA